MEVSIDTKLSNVNWRLIYSFESSQKLDRNIASKQKSVFLNDYFASGHFTKSCSFLLSMKCYSFINHLSGIISHSKSLFIIKQTKQGLFVLFSNSYSNSFLVLLQSINQYGIYSVLRRNI